MRVLHEDTPRHTLRELRVRHGYSGYSGAQAGVTVAQEQQRNLDGSGSARRAEVHGSSERFESADTKQHLKDKGPEGRRMRHARRSPAGRSSFSTLGRALSTASAARPLTADNPQQIPIGSLQRSGALAKWSPVQPPRSWISTSAPLQAAMRRASKHPPHAKRHATGALTAPVALLPRACAPPSKPVTTVPIHRVRAHLQTSPATHTPACGITVREAWQRRRRGWDSSVPGDGTDGRACLSNDSIVSTCPQAAATCSGC